MELRDKIDEYNNIIFHEINNGVYKAGFARSQEAYEEAYDLVFNRLDWLEERLSHSRYLLGDNITESDVRLYVTLARFDIAYYNGFNLNRNRISEFPNLWGYVRDLYSEPDLETPQILMPSKSIITCVRYPTILMDYYQKAQT